MGASTEGERPVQDRGQFTHAVCRSCGWVGPARRSRAKASRDHAEHDLDGHDLRIEWARDAVSRAVEPRPPTTQ